MQLLLSTVIEEALSEKEFHFLRYQRPPLTTTLEEKFGVFATLDAANRILILTGSSSAQIRKAKLDVRYNLVRLLRFSL